MNTNTAKARIRKSELNLDDFEFDRSFGELSIVAKGYCITTSEERNASGNADMLEAMNERRGAAFSRARALVRLFPGAKPYLSGTRVVGVIFS